ncbi:unnamed protein product [Caenorhabditis auriculariae]|uniref:Uncharacterized protein n=1 Tax=Caenorhabditis auriculariae TaxID=2777116 RepID=A0A8S1HE69_9PELO|nr:unnamed protein product [Caenorhabditis auriculariae]
MEVDTEKVHKEQDAKLLEEDEADPKIETVANEQVQSEQEGSNVQKETEVEFGPVKKSSPFLPSDQHSYGLLARDNGIENIWHLIKDFQEPKDMIYAVFDDSLGNFVIQNEKLNDYFGRNLWKLKEKMQFYMAHHLKSSAERLLKMEETLALEDLENFRIEVMNFLGNSEGEATILCKWGKLPSDLTKDQKVEDFMRSVGNFYFDPEDLMTHHGILRKEPIIFEKEILEALFMFTQRVVLQLLRIALNVRFFNDGHPKITYDGNIKIEEPILGNIEAFLKRDKITYRMVLPKDENPNIWHLIEDFKSPDEMVRAVFPSHIYEEVVANIGVHFKVFKALQSLRSRMSFIVKTRLNAILESVFNGTPIINDILPILQQMADFLTGPNPEQGLVVKSWFSLLKPLEGANVTTSVCETTPMESILKELETFKAPYPLRQKILLCQYYFCQRLSLQFIRLTTGVQIKDGKIWRFYWLGMNGRPRSKSKETERKRKIDEESSPPAPKIARENHKVTKKAINSKNDSSQHEKISANYTPMPTSARIFDGLSKNANPSMNQGCGADSEDNNLVMKNRQESIEKEQTFSEFHSNANVDKDPRLNFSRIQLKKIKCSRPAKEEKLSQSDTIMITSRSQRVRQGSLVEDESPAKPKKDPQLEEIRSQMHQKFNVLKNTIENYQRDAKNRQNTTKKEMENNLKTMMKTVTDNMAQMQKNMEKSMSKMLASELKAHRQNEERNSVEMQKAKAELKKRDEEIYELKAELAGTRESLLEARQDLNKLRQGQNKRRKQAKKAFEVEPENFYQPVSQWEPRRILPATQAHEVSVDIKPDQESILLDEDLLHHRGVYFSEH